MNARVDVPMSGVAACGEAGRELEGVMEREEGEKWSKLYLKRGSVLELPERDGDEKNER